MKKTLEAANEKQAYLLVDRATWLFNRKDVSLKECFQDDPALLTEYSLIAVNPARHEGINHAGAKAFIKFVTSEAGKALIMDHKVKGRTLFMLSTLDE
jgi:tungstate transport system substrate-binding protein